MPDEPADYPDVPERGIRMRWLPFPVRSPDRTPPDLGTATRKKDGRVVSIAATLGLPVAGDSPPGDETDQVHDWHDPFR